MKELRKTTDRFELEQQIMDCWKITDDLCLLNECVIENNLTTDKISNILTGIEQLYDLKFKKMFETFEACVKSNQLSD